MYIIRYHQYIIENPSFWIFPNFVSMSKESSSCSPPNCSEWFVRDVTDASHKALTKSLATDSIVLLKNEESMLPISGLVLAGAGKRAGLGKMTNWGNNERC